MLSLRVVVGGMAEMVVVAWLAAEALQRLWLRDLLRPALGRGNRFGRGWWERRR